MSLLDWVSGALQKVVEGIKPASGRTELAELMEELERESEALVKKEIQIYFREDSGGGEHAESG